MKRALAAGLGPAQASGTDHPVHIASAGLRLIALAGLYTAVLAFGLFLLWRDGGSVKDAGWMWEKTDAGVQVRTVDPQGPAGILTPGSRVLAVDGDHRASQSGPRPWLQAVQPGESYRLEWQTPNGGRQQATFPMGKRRSDRDLEMGICDLLLSLCFALGGFFIWAARPNDLVARPTYVAALLTAFFLVGSAVGPISPQLRGAPFAIYFLLKSIFPFYMIAGCALFARFPTGVAPKEPWKSLLAVLWVLGSAAWIFALPKRLFPHLGLESRLTILSGLDLNTRPELGDVAIRHGLIALCALFLFSVAIFNYRRLASEAMRLRVRWVMLGTTLGVAPALLYSFTMASADAGHLISAASVQHMVRLYTLATLGLAAIPLTFVYAILADRLMGIRVAISTGIQYLAARRVFQVLTLLPAIPVASYLWSHRAQPLAESLSRPVVFVPLALSAMLLIARKELLDLFDRLLCRMRGDHQRIMQDLLEALFDQHSAGAIAEATAERLQRALRPERLVIYCGESDVPVLPRAFATSNVPAPFVMARDGELAGVLSERGPAFLNASFAARLSASECAWIPQSGLVLAVPIAGELRAELAGIILLGAKSSGDPYWATDLDLLEDTARQVYLALKMRDVEKARDRAVRERELAEESERTRAEFLAQISHELRNPLHGVVGLTDLLLGTPLSEEQKSYTELIRRSSEWTVAIANDIVNLPALDLHTVPLNRVAFEWVALLEDFAVMAAEWGREPDVEVVLQIDLDAPLMTRSDPQRVRQVVLNLLVNAVKFTERGWVLLHAGRGQSASGSETMVITVEDTGPGIAHEFRDKLFQPFERSAAGSGPSGTGLGLAISKRLAHALGGDLTYEPRTGGGARFRFILPAAADRSQLPVETKPLEGVRILVVDSLPVRMWGTCLSLAALGASPTGSVSPSDPSVDNQHDLVILAGGDSRDAVHAIREVRRSHTGAPILLLHRGNGRLGQDDVEALGNIEQLHRPAPRNVLLGAIERCLAPPSDRAAFPESEDLSKDACTGIRILVVEDDPATANIHVMMLRWLGCTVRTTSAALDALAMLESEEWDAVFVDGKLAGMDGFELTRSIRRLRGAVRAIPVIAVCGDAGSLSRIQFFEAGADDYLVKPATAAAFRQVIQTRVVPRLRARTHRANEAWR